MHILNIDLMGTIQVNTEFHQPRLNKDGITYSVDLLILSLATN